MKDAGKRKPYGTRSEENGSDQTNTRRSPASLMSRDLEIQETLAKMSVPEIIDAMTKLTEVYAEELAILTHELLIRAMELAGDLKDY